jgi:hypothetical protein
MPAVGEYPGNDLPGLSIYGWGWTRHPPHSVRAGTVLIIPLDREANGRGHAALRVEWLWVGALLSRVLDGNNLAAAYHHGVLVGPIAVFVVSVPGVRIGLSDNERLADNQHNGWRHRHRHSIPRSRASPTKSLARVDFLISL